MEKKPAPIGIPDVITTPARGTLLPSRAWLTSHRIQTSIRWWRIFVDPLFAVAAVGTLGLFVANAYFWVSLIEAGVIGPDSPFLQDQAFDSVHVTLGFVILFYLGLYVSAPEREVRGYRALLMNTYLSAQRAACVLHSAAETLRVSTNPGHHTANIALHIARIRDLFVYLPFRVMEARYARRIPGTPQLPGGEDMGLRSGAHPMDTLCDYLTAARIELQSCAERAGAFVNVVDWHSVFDPVETAVRVIDDATQSFTIPIAKRACELILLGYGFFLPLDLYKAYTVYTPVVYILVMTFNLFLVLLIVWFSLPFDTRRDREYRSILAYWAYAFSFRIEMRFVDVFCGQRRTQEMDDIQRIIDRATYATQLPHVSAAGVPLFDSL